MALEPTGGENIIVLSQQASQDELDDSTDQRSFPTQEQALKQKLLNAGFTDDEAKHTVTHLEADNMASLSAIQDYFDSCKQLGPVGDNLLYYTLGAKLPTGKLSLLPKLMKVITTQPGPRLAPNGNVDNVVDSIASKVKLERIKKVFFVDEEGKRSHQQPKRPDDNKQLHQDMREFLLKKLQHVTVTREALPSSRRKKPYVQTYIKKGYKWERDIKKNLIPKFIATYDKYGVSSMTPTDDAEKEQLSIIVDTFHHHWENQMYKTNKALARGDVSIDSIQATATALGGDVVNTEAGAQPKRGRGRPRKNKAESGVDQNAPAFNESSDATQAPAAAGGASGSGNTAATPADNTKAAQQKRKRGRPKKKAAQSDSDDDDSEFTEELSDDEYLEAMAASGRYRACHRRQRR